MARIDIDDDVLEFLRSKVVDFEETPSSVLRRILGIARSGEPVGPAAVDTSGSRPARLERSELSPLALDRDRLAPATTAIARFKLILSILYQANRKDFDSICNIHGRRRKYFSTNRRELSDSGSSVNPEAIPGSPYFVATNLSNQIKRTILEEVMDALGYAPSKTREVVELVDPSSFPRQAISLGPSDRPDCGDDGLQI